MTIRHTELLRCFIHHLDEQVDATEICSATATHASLPDTMAMPLMISLQRTFVPSPTNIFEPPFQAFC